MSNHNVRAVGFNVLVMPTAKDEKTAGGIHLPEQWQQPRGEGTVIALGAKVETYEGTLRYGARVLFNWLDRRTVEQDGKELWLLDSRQLLGVVE